MAFSGENKRSFSSAFSGKGELPGNDGKKKKRDSAAATDDSEGELPENDGNKEKRDAATATDDCDESDSGEEGISIEELKKTTGWKLLMKNLNKHFKPKDFDSQ